MPPTSLRLWRRQPTTMKTRGAMRRRHSCRYAPRDGMGWGRGVAWRFCPALHETGGLDTLHARIPSGHDGNDGVLHLRGCCFHCCEDRGRVKLVLFCTARTRSWMYFWVLGVLTREVAFRRRIRIARYPNWSACFHPHTRGRPLASFGVVGAGWVQSTWLRLRWVRGCGVRVDCLWTCWVTYLAECFLPSLGCARYYIDTCEFVFLILGLVGTKRPYVGVAKKSMAALIIAPRFSRGITRRPLHNRVIGSLALACLSCGGCRSLSRCRAGRGR